MSMTAPSFYVTGGTLQQNAPSYVERQADRELYDGLCRGEFCYLLTSRQMGKSSLMVRTAARLNEDGITAAVLDLTALGQNLTVEQWYDGLLHHLGRQLDLEDDLEEYWLCHERRGPLQRWMGALREVVLGSGVRAFRRSGVEEDASSGTERLNVQDHRQTAPAVPPERHSRIVIFIDEIDVVQSLPFSTDEFFAAIRECYNRRTRDPEFQRLTFCLIGVATPSDLIQDVRTTPFNIGQRIELTDFTPAEAAPLAAGLARSALPALALAPVPARSLSDAERLLQRILYWTGGHPYLTQRLCQAVAAEATDDPQFTKQDPQSVDRLCDELFLSHRARERDDNLLFVRDRLLRSGADAAALLSLYARVHSPRQQVPDDETNPLVSRLRLSGIVREVGGFLKVRNRIYAQVFDRPWVEASLPDAELRRLRALAREEASRRRYAEEQRRLAEERELTARRYLYVANLNVAQHALEAGNLGRAMELLTEQIPELGQEDLRGFEWYYLYRQAQGDEQHTFGGHSAVVTAVAFSPDGKLLATGSDDLTVKLWDLVTREEAATLHGHTGHVHSVAYSPDGRLLASVAADKLVKLWDVSRRRELATLEGHDSVIWSVAFSPDGKLLASGSDDGTVVFWDVSSLSQITSLKAHLSLCALAFSRDGRLLATGGYDPVGKLWEVGTGREIATFPGKGVRSLDFSPDGRTVAMGGHFDGCVLWDIAAGRELMTLMGHRAWVWSAVFSPDGRMVATGSFDSTVKLWDVAEGREIREFHGHTGRIGPVAFSPDGRTVASGSVDGTARLWDARKTRQEGILRGHEDAVSRVRFSPDGKTLASASSDGTIRLWDVAQEHQVACLEGHGSPVSSVAFSPDGSLLASSSSEESAVRLWDVAAHWCRSTLQRDTAPVYQVAFSPDGALLVTICTDGTAMLWDPALGQVITFISGHLGLAAAVAFTPSGSILATMDEDDRTIRLWDLADPEWQPRLIDAFKAHRGEVFTVSFSPDGKLVASGGSDGTIRLWDVAAKREAAALTAHNGAVSSLAFTPDGRTLVSVSFEDTAAVKLWNMATRREVAILKGHSGGVHGAGFSPDGRILATAGSDRTVRLWRAASDEGTESQGCRSQ